MKLKKIFCTNCGKPIYRSSGRINENSKLNHNFYCSQNCESRYKTKKRELLCENCGKSFLRQISQISSHNYCSHSCAIVSNNKKYPRKNRIKPVLKTCVVCKGQYKKSSGNKKYCSMKCRSEAERYAPEELLEIIRAVFKKTGVPPARREFSNGADKACVRFFGSWNNAILTAGFIPNRSHDDRMYKRVSAKSLDGHLCDSASELLIDNWLYKNNIPHIKNSQYPATNHKTDWELFNNKQRVFVEYFGLANDSPRYDRTVREKKMLCDKHRISLIPIYPVDLYPNKYLEDNLREKFKNYL